MAPSARESAKKINLIPLLFQEELAIKKENEARKKRREAAKEKKRKDDDCVVLCLCQILVIAGRIFV